MGTARSTAGARVVANALVVAAAAFLTFGLASTSSEPSAEAKDKPAPKGKFEYGCRVQHPQRFLERRSFVRGGALDPTRHARALRFMSLAYGNAGDSETEQWNSDAAFSHAKTMSFLGLPITVHSKIVPALQCVAKRIKKQCTGKSSYTPKAVGGFRTSNTYRGGEISNHMFGVAIDIDPDRNPCCGCVDPWPSSPLCQKDAKDAYERTSLTKCWINSFEHFGFDWLGHDELEDTMHFEFLGDPDKITK